MDLPLLKEKRISHVHELPAINHIRKKKKNQRASKVIWIPLVPATPQVVKGGGRRRKAARAGDLWPGTGLTRGPRRSLARNRVTKP